MLEPWRNPAYLTRAWCLFELYTAIGTGGDVKIDVVLTTEEDASFVAAMGSGEGYHVRVPTYARCFCKCSLFV